MLIQKKLIFGFFMNQNVQKTYVNDIVIKAIYEINNYTIEASSAFIPLRENDKDIIFNNCLIF